MALRVDNPELHKQICNTYENVVDDGEILENEQGELAIVYGGAYYPLQSGKWIVQEAFEVEDEMEYEDVGQKVHSPGQDAISDEEGFEIAFFKEHRREVRQKE